MKRLTVEYLGYKLEVTIEILTPHERACNEYPYIKGTCNAIYFVKTCYYKNCSPIIDEFIKAVDEEYEEEARNEALAVLD
jgi:hypothetical protein